MSKDDAVITRKCFILFFAFLIVLSVQTSYAAEDSPDKIARVREITLENSYKAVLKENEDLQKKSRKLEEDLKKARITKKLYIERIKNLNRNIDSLNSELTGLRRDTQDMHKISQELDLLKQKNENLKRRILNAAVFKNDNSPKSGKKALTYKQRLAAENNRLHYNMGNFFFRKAKYKKALESYEKALEFLPGDADTLYNIAIIWDYYLKDNEKAIRYYFSYLKSEPNALKAGLVKERIAENQLEKKLNRRLK